jgi:hypothetical protein
VRILEGSVQFTGNLPCVARLRPGIGPTDSRAVIGDGCRKLTDGRLDSLPGL